MGTAIPLREKKCKPCEGMGEPMGHAAIEMHLKETPGWQLNEDSNSISRLFVMKNFMAAVNFIAKIAQIAEAEDHHPDIHLTGYRKLKIDLSTHAIGGLSENDFIVAAKVNELPAELKEPKK